MGILLLFPSIFAGYFILYTIYNLFFHPLRSTPGPFLCRISAFPSCYHAYLGDRHVWTWRLFQIYGPKIRVTPNSVLFNTPDAHNTIFSHRANVKKGAFYDAWSRKESEVNTLGVVDVKEHARRRKMLNQAFTEKSTKAAGKIAERHIERWGELLLEGSNTEGNDGWTESRNIAEWTGHLMFDIMGEMAFGKQLDVKETGFDSEFKSIPGFAENFMAFMYPIVRSPFIHFFVWLKPRGLNKLFKILTPPNIAAYWTFIETTVVDRVNLEKTRESNDKGVQPQDRDWFSFLLAIRDETGKQGLDIDELTGEASLLVVAGHETSANTTCATFFYLAHNPRVLVKLAKELRETFESVEDIVYGTKLSGCTYLRACIDEAMRLSPPAPSELERDVTAGGITIEGQFYPPGITVGVPHFSLDRNEAIYGDSYTYRPERWIVSHDMDTLNTEEDVKRLKECFYPFSKGPGNCAGQAIAILQMTILIARTIWRAELRITPGDYSGGGSEELGWGQRDRKLFVYKDKWVTQRHGPMLQFRKRTTG